MNPIKFGVLTVSDTCYSKENIDKSGPKLVSLIEENFKNSEIVFIDIVPDDVDAIKSKLINWSDRNCDVIFTTGGTGLSPRDVTPEATKSIIEKDVPGLVHVILSKSLAITPYAMLSRPVIGIRNKTLIINFPGSEKAVTENFAFISQTLPHTISIIKDDKTKVKETHCKLQNNSENSDVVSKVKIDTVATRARVSKYKMYEVDEAHRIITTTCAQTSESEVLDINNVLGRVLAEDVQSLDPLPPFPASIKDGYAVKASDGAGKRIVVDVMAAGDDPNAEELKPGQCVRISTGAPVPPGADAVVQVEDTELTLASEDSTKELEINIKISPKLGQDIRPIGSDIEAHTIILKKGTVINAPEIGVLAAVGKVKVKVVKRMKIGVISTGNEVQDPNEPLQSGRIRDTNKITLLNLLKQYSYEANDCGVARDEPSKVKRTLAKAFDTCDFVITTGGVSMGEFDVIKQVLIEDFGANVHFGRVNMKPGKPTTFATCLYQNKVKIIFGLPGNPVSSTVTCLLFVIPALRHCENRSEILFPKIWVSPNFQVKPDRERPDYQRVMLKYSVDGNILATSTGNQISSKLNSFVCADGLMLVKSCQQEESQISKYLCYVLNKF